MKRMKILAAFLALMMLAGIPALVPAEEAYGSAAIAANQTYTLEQMLTLALQDETMAQAEYQAIIGAYGDKAPFANIVGAEETHITLLKTLFETHGFTLPENTAAGRVTLPASLDEAYTTGITAENANIAMYENFLKQTDLPEDVRSTFVVLQNASQNHLVAYTRNSEKTGMGSQNGRNGGMMNGKGNRTGATNAQNGCVSGDCPLNNGDGTTCNGCGTQQRGGMNRTN